MILIKHFPALQIISLFFGALFSVLTFQHVKLAKIIAIISVLISLYLSAHGLSAELPFVYYFGNWVAPIGIEYKLDYLNQPIIIYINCVMLFCLVFCNELINTTVLRYIDKKRQSIFYAILLFAHAGYVGIVSTNDLFNLYVFIEISSLSTYVLMAQGANRNAVVGAFDYLMLGTIGATLILISIGLLLSYTGSLNMTDISKLLAANYNSKIILISISFFLIGAILKTAFFPMHFWMVRAYSSVAPVILTYMAGISNIVGIYIIFRFIHFTIDYSIITNLFTNLIKPLALATIVLCSYFALIQEKTRNILIYSSASQICYVFFLLTIPKGNNIIFPFVLADSLNKIALLFIIAYRESYSVKNFKNLGMMWQVLVSFILICSAGLPITSMFIIKLNIFQLLISENQWIGFIVVIIGSCMAFLYNYKIFKKLFFEQDYNYNQGIVSSNIKYYGIFFITVTQIVLLLYLSHLQAFYNNILGG